MTTATRTVPEQGQLVSVRSRQWTVQQVRASTLPPPALQPSFNGPQHLVTLASVEDDGLGEELQVVWEVEPGARGSHRAKTKDTRTCPLHRATKSPTTPWRRRSRRSCAGC